MLFSIELMIVDSVFWRAGGLFCFALPSSSFSVFFCCFFFALQGMLLVPAQATYVSYSPAPSVMAESMVLATPLPRHAPEVNYMSPPCSFGSSISKSSFCLDHRHRPSIREAVFSLFRSSFFIFRSSLFVLHSSLLVYRRRLK